MKVLGFWLRKTKMHLNIPNVSRRTPQAACRTPSNFLALKFSHIYNRLFGDLKKPSKFVTH